MKISFSSLKTFQTCPVAYKFRYIDGRIPVRDPAAFAIGTLFHEVTALYWTDGRHAARDYLMSHTGDVDPVDVANLAGALSVYDPPVDEYDVIGVEVPFKARVRNPATGYPLHNIEMIGFADMILMEKMTGKKWVREFKTTSSQILGFGPFWQRLMVDAQIIIYQDVFDADGILYDCVKKPRYKVSAVDRKGATNESEEIVNLQSRVTAKCAENPEEWHQIRPIHKTNAEFQDGLQSVFDGVRALTSGVKADRFPCHSNSCVMYGSCQYLEVCAGREDLWDNELFCDYVRAT